MTLKKISGAGLIALAALILCVILADGALAQTAPAAPAAPPAPPPKLDTGDTAWMLTSTALVLMMTIPGLALFYGGMVRKKNVLATVMQSFAITCLVTVLWTVIGYSWAFTEGSGYLGGNSRFLLMGMGVGALNATIPEVGVHDLPDDLRHHHAGTDLRRLRRPHEVLGDVLVHEPVVAVRLFADRALGLGAWRLLGGLGVLDFAGGTVVHINAGVAGLMCALVLGKRKGLGHENMAPHNLVLTMIGASLLWVGWFGFNAGSAVASNGAAGMAMAVTQIATGTAALAWMFAEWAIKGKPSILGICSGAVAGLVAITPASGFVDPIGALCIGVAAGIGCYWGATGLKHAFGYDDSLDAFGVHAVGGIIGAMLTGVFAREAIAKPGLFDGNAYQIVLQFYGVMATIIYDAIATLIILFVIKAIMGLRVSEEIERDGLDIGLHGEVVQ